MMLRSDKKKTRNQKKSMINKSMAKSLLRHTKKVVSAKQKQKQHLETKKKLVQIVDSEITFNFKKEIKKKPVPLSENEKPVLPNNNENIPDKHSSVIIPNQSESIAPPKLIQAPTIPEKKSEQVEVVDDEVSFNFKTPTKIEPEIKTEDMKMEWLKTMVIIYDIIFDIKTEKKDDYEEKVKFPKKKKKRRRFGRY